MTGQKNKFLIVTTVAESMPFFKGQLHVLKQNFEVELISSSGSHLVEMSESHAVKSHPIEMKREISLRNDPVSLWKLTLLFLKLKPHIVHGNTPKASLLSMVASWLARVPNRVYYVHGLRYHGEIGKKKKVLMFMEKISCYLATDVVAVSSGVKKALAFDKITSKNVHVIGNGSVNGIDLKQFNPAESDSTPVLKQFNIAPDNFVFGFIGRLVGDKGINELVSVFKELSIQNPKIRLLLVGKFESTLDPLSEKTLNEINSNDSILFAGPQKDVRPFLKAMNVFVFPSYREGFGISLMEAGAMQLAAISSDITGCNEIITNSENGLLIESKNEKALFDAMEFCLQNPQEVNRMAQNARKFIENHFEQQKLWELTLDFYTTKLKNN